jgi:hypothetical protein
VVHIVAHPALRCQTILLAPSTRAAHGLHLE